jgi:ABC-type Mn2+/Zn2+ transport system permease subunit
MPQGDQQPGDIRIGFEELEKFLKHNQVTAVRTTLLDKISTLVFVALGLITALAWEDTFKATFSYIFGGVETIGQKALYAFVITLITVLISVYFGKYFMRKSEK